MVQEKDLERTDADQLACEEELWRRVRALDRHVLGEPHNAPSPRSSIALWAGLLYVLLLMLWAGLLLDPLAGTGLADSTKQSGFPLLGFSISLLGAPLLSFSILMRYWLLAALNIALVAAYVITTALGVVDPRLANLPVFG